MDSEALTLKDAVAVQPSVLNEAGWELAISAGAEVPPLDAWAWNWIGTLRRKAKEQYPDDAAVKAAIEVANAGGDKQATREARRKAVGIPPRLWPVLDALKPTAAVGAVREFLADKDLYFLVLRGDRGVGKTVAGAWAIESKGGVLCEAQELVQAGQFDRAFWENLREAHVLVIDELGSESMDPRGSWYGTMLFSVCNHRYSHLRKTILAGNLSRADFELRYLTQHGERLRDRLRECGWDMPVGGESMRETATVREPGEEG